MVHETLTSNAMSLLSPFARAKRWTNTDNFKMSVHVTVKSVSLHNALDASASYLAIAIARGQKRFKTLKAVWSSGEAVCDRLSNLDCVTVCDVAAVTAPDESLVVGDEDFM